MLLPIENLQDKSDTTNYSKPSVLNNVNSNHKMHLKNENIKPFIDKAYCFKKK